MIIKRGLVVLFFILALSGVASASLGISPAYVNVNFVPDEVMTFKFTVFSDDPSQEIIISIEGDLAPYSTVSKTEIIGTDTVYVTIHLPSTLERPGEHQLSVGAKEKVPEQSFIATVINIMVFIKVYVPYPGKYVEMKLNAPDGNVDDKIPLELEVINRGKENLLFEDVHIDFFTEGKKVYTLPFNVPVQINTTQTRYFRKYLDTAGFKAGNYFASAVVNYGDKRMTNATFKIGSLFVNVTNHTEKLKKGGIQKFHIGIESKWNSDLDSVYAEVNISKGIGEGISFKTPPVDLRAWQRKTIESFVETENLEGEYGLDITLNYAGQKTNVKGKVKVVKYEYLPWIIAGAAIMFIIVVVIVWIMVRRHRRRK